MSGAPATSLDGTLRAIKDDCYRDNLANSGAFASWQFPRLSLRSETSTGLFLVYLFFYLCLIRLKISAWFSINRLSNLLDTDKS